jgi:hypothetical protein
VTPTRTWLAVSPVLLAGVLVAHWLAYRLTETPAGPTHEYLDHTPQALGVLTLVALLTVAIGGPLRIRPAWQLPLAALACFVVQEHVERLVHTGELPWILASPAFLAGMLLQVPVALLAWALARRLLEVLREPIVGPARLPHPLLAIAAPATFEARCIVGAPLPGRGPPPRRDPR